MADTLGPTLICDDGFRDMGGRCVELPSVTNGRYVGSTLICDDGFRDMGGRCVELPSVTNGRYVGSTLICDDGFRDMGGRCVELPSVTNGRYVGSTLICDDGFRDMGGRCVELPSVTNGQKGGSTRHCKQGSRFDGGKCVSAGGSVGVDRRIDSAPVGRTSRAPSIADGEQTTKFEFIWLFILALLLAVYMIPFIVASSRAHPQKMPILILNIFLGWTLLGWVGALVWAVANFKRG